jgi:hypothetical protein
MPKMYNSLRLDRIADAPSTPTRQHAASPRPRNARPKNVHPLAWETALTLADGDQSRLHVADEMTVIVR